MHCAMVARPLRPGLYGSSQAVRRPLRQPSVTRASDPSARRPPSSTPVQLGGESPAPEARVEPLEQVKHPLAVECDDLDSAEANGGGDVAQVDREVTAAMLLPVRVPALEQFLGVLAACQSVAKVVLQRPWVTVDHVDSVDIAQHMPSQGQLPGVDPFPLRQSRILQLSRSVAQTTASLYRSWQLGCRRPATVVAKPCDASPGISTTCCTPSLLSH
jgi:hypothetical protein